jgi:hypothetical protein
MNSRTTPITCRWKRLRGEGRGAFYRASCGHETCPGHLGDLAYVDSLRDQLWSYLKRHRRDPERLRAGDGPRLWTKEETESTNRREVDAILRQGRQIMSEWLMSAEPLETKRAPSHHGDAFYRRHAFYRGYADTGYRISRGGKRTPDGWQVPRRSMEGISRDVRVDGVAVDHIEGQAVRPADKVQCPVCSQLTLFDRAHPLKVPRGQ